MPDPAFIRALLDLGMSGLLLIGLLAFATGKVVPGKDRDDWRKIAQDQTANAQRLADALETRNRIDEQQLAAARTRR